MSFIGDDIGTVVAGLRTQVDGPPYYMYGHRREIRNRLMVMDKSATLKTKKYPLFILMMDSPAPVDLDMELHSLNIVIVTFTTLNKNAEQRITTVVDPILYPLYEDFMSALVHCGLFANLGPYDHTRIERPLWGVPGDDGTERYFLNDPVDAIELLNLRLNKELCV